MVTPQINIRVPAHLHPLIKRMGELLRLRPDLGERIAAVVEELEAEAGADAEAEAGSAAQARLAPESSTARLEALEATVAALERRLEALEPAAVPEAPKPRRPSKNSKLGVIARKAGLPLP